MGFSFSKTEKMLYTLHLFLAHTVLLVLRLIVPSVEQLCIVISQKKVTIVLREHIECVSRATKRHNNY